MRIRTLAAAACAVTGLAAAAVAGTEDVAFPKNYKDTFSRYVTVDKPHPTRGPSIRDIFVDPAALAAVKAGKKLPSGTVFVMEVYKAKQDAQKKPLPGADGRFVKDGMIGVFVMEKRTGWGAGYPAAIRNGEWEYARFNADGGRHKDRDMKSCFTCHKAKASADYVFTTKPLGDFARK